MTPHRFAWPLAALWLLVACTPGVADRAGDAAVDTGASCTGNPIADALPATQSVDGRQVVWRSCDAVSASAGYGHEDADGGGDHCTVTLTDTGAAPPDATRDPGLGGMMEHANAMLLDMTKFNVQALVEARKGLLEEPVILDIRGGASTLPVVEQLSNGDTWVVSVPARDQRPIAQSMMAVLRDRYALDVKCTEPVRDHDQAATLYRPYAAALRPERLP